MSKIEQKIAWLFPGQGIQEVGMGLKLYKKSPLAMYLYDTADMELGYKISDISFYGPKANWIKPLIPNLLSLFTTMFITSLPETKEVFVYLHTLQETLQENTMLFWLQGLMVMKPV